MHQRTFIKHVPEDPHGLLFHLCLQEDDGGEILMLRSRDEKKLQPLIERQRGESLPHSDRCAGQSVSCAYDRNACATHTP